jgi:hypothetical protein
MDGQKSVQFSGRADFITLFSPLRQTSNYLVHSLVLGVQPGSHIAVNHSGPNESNEEWPRRRPSRLYLRRSWSKLR